MEKKTYDGMTTERDGNGFHYPIPIPVKKFILISISKPNGYQSFIPSSSPSGNGYNLVLIPVSLPLQYKF